MRKTLVIRPVASGQDQTRGEIIRRTSLHGREPIFAGHSVRRVHNPGSIARVVRRRLMWSPVSETGEHGHVPPDDPIHLSELPGLEDAGGAETQGEGGNGPVDQYLLADPDQPAIGEGQDRIGAGRPHGISLSPADDAGDEDLLFIGE